jgi:hypothetical protein
MTGRYVTVGMSPWSFCANVLPVEDLNYRLNLPDEDVRHLLCSIPTTQGIHALLQFDEVRLFDKYDRCPFLKLLFAAAEEFYSWLQSIHGIRRTSHIFPSVGRTCLSVVAPTDSFNRTYRFTTNTLTDATGYDIKYLPSSCMIVSVIYLLHTSDANQPGRIVYYTNFPLLSQSARDLTMRIHGSP